MSDYAHPEVIVSTEWLADHLNDSNLRIIESDEDVLLYEQGHIPGAIKFDWMTEQQDQLQRDFVDRAAFENLCSQKGIGNDNTLVFYGDKNNWYATYTWWLFAYYGHDYSKLKILDGGRAKWIAEGRPLTRDVPNYPQTQYKAQDRDDSIRAFRSYVEQHLNQPNAALIDVRSPGEYSGELYHAPGYPQEGAQRKGHIPGAANIGWGKALREDGTFKSPDELRKLYENEGITPEKEVITYCRIGERSSHTWFVLTQLLGYPNVRNYDGSWTEWGNAVGLPIETGTPAKSS